MKKLLFLMLAVLPLAATARENIVDMPRRENVPAEVAAAPLYGKTMVIFGDSYVKNHVRPITETWHYKIAAKYNMRYRNYGWNGNAISIDRTGEGFGPAMYERYAEMTDTADYVIIMAGHNDAAMFGSRVTPELFKEKLKVFCEGLIDKFPSARIVFITPWNVPRDGFPQVIDILKEVCASYSIPVYDAAHEGGIYVWNEKFRRMYFQAPTDTAHLNSAGHDLFMGRAERFLLSL